MKVNYLKFSKRILSLVTLVVLSISQLTPQAFANEIASGNSGTANTSANHHIETPNYVNDAAHLLASINPQVVNPNIEISTILHNVVNSSLDLSSVLHSVNVGNLTGSVAISLGNHHLEVTSNEFITPSEALAVSQVLINNHQSLVLDALGQATRGSLDASTLGSNVNNLVISNGVTLVDSASKLIINGNLANYGDIVFNGSGNLQANAILNSASGQISSSGVLGISTNALMNEGGIYGATGVNLNSAVIYNAGTIEAGVGNINIASANTLDITGTQNSIFEANNGDINIAINAGSLSQGLNLANSIYLSNELNLNTSSGYIKGVTQNVTGQINVNANSIILATASKDMLLGNDKVNGDPTYVNTAGDISLNGAVTSSGANLAIIASGNINVASGSAASITTAGGNLTMIAGVGSNITSSGNTNSTGVPTGATATTSSITVTLGVASNNTGGNIDLVTNNALTTGSNVIDTSNTTGNGGNITLVAIANGTTGGEVLTSNATNTYNITAASTDVAIGISGGSVLIIAGADPSTATNTIVLGNITTNGGIGTTGTAGSVSLYTQALASANVIFDTTGSITSGSITNNGSNIANAGISVGNITTSGLNGIDNSSLSTGVAGGNGEAGGNITIQSGGNITTIALTANGGNGGGGATGVAGTTTGNGGNGGNSGNIVINASGSITTSSVLASGGNGGGGGGNSAGIAVNGGAGGNGGNIIINTSGSIITSSMLASGGNGGNCGENFSTYGSVLGGSGNGGNGGNGAAISISTKGGISTSSIESFGGVGGSGSGNIVGGVLTGGNGGNGGNGAVISVSSTNGSISTSSIESFGGGGGGVLGGGGDGGNGAAISISTKGGISTSSIESFGGDGGVIGGNGGGGNGAAISVSSTNGSISTSSIESFGGVGGGDGGNGAAISISTKGGISTSSIESFGGDGGVLGGNGAVISVSSTNGSISTSSIESFGGVGGGDGGNGAAISISTKGGISTSSIESFGGDGGVLGGNGAAISISTKGGISTSSIGSFGGGGVLAGNGGAISITTTNGNITITLTTNGDYILNSAGGGGGGVVGGGGGVVGGGGISITATSGNITIIDPVDPNRSLNGGGIDWVNTGGGLLELNAYGTLNILTPGHYDSSQYSSNADYAYSIKPSTSTASVIGSGSLNITESGLSIPIFNGTAVTPSELIALVQVITTGIQTIVLTGTGAGTGYASGGSFNINSQNIANIPNSNFINLDLPSGVTANVNVSSLTYTGSAIIDGTMNFNSPTSVLTLESNTNINGVVNFNGSGNNSIISNGTLTNTGSILDHNSGNLTLQSVTGNINTAAINVGSATLDLNAGGSITNSGLLTAGIINLNTAGGFITTNANVIASIINFTTNGSGGITINSQIGTAAASDILNSSGSGYITTGTNGSIIGDSLSLVSNNGEIGFGVGGLQPLNTQASNIVFSAGLSVSILNNSANLNIGNSGSGANVYLENTGNLTDSGTIIAPVVGLYSFNGSSGIGSANNLMQINAHNIGIESYGAGSSVYVNDIYNGSTIMQASQSLDIFKLDTAGPLTIYAQVDQNNVVTPGIISGQIIAIQTMSGYGIYNDANIQATDFIFLTASQTGYIAQPSSGALMTAPNIALVSGGGSIGAGGNLLLNSANVAASTQGLNSFVNIYDEASRSGIFGGQSGSNFTFNTNGNLNVYGSIGTGAGSGAPGGSITLNANGVINLGTTSPINLTTNNGSITVQNNNTTSGSINVAKGDFILGSSTNANYGFVTLNIGPASQANTTNPSPTNISIKSAGGAQVYFGNNGITASAGGNVLFANGRSITFNTGSLGANSITLGGNVSITADPPAVSSENVNNISALSTPVIQNNLNNLGNGIIDNNAANTQYTANTQVINVLDNNQAGISTSVNSSKLNNPNIETGYLNNNYNDESNEIVENTSLFMPIAYNSIATAQASSQARKLSLTNYKSYIGQINSQITTTDNHVTITQGSSIIIASHDLTIKLGVIKPITVTLKCGAVVLAITNGGVTSIYNLHDNNKDSVIVKLPNSKINLYPGHQVTFAVANQVIDFAYINQVAKIGYRAIKTSTHYGVITYESDFSIPSAISAIKPLKAMFSSNDRLIKNLANRLLKTSVVVTQSTNYKGIYEQVSKPKLTALK